MISPGHSSRTLQDLQERYWLPLALWVMALARTRVMRAAQVAQATRPSDIRLDGAQPMTLRELRSATVGDSQALFGAHVGAVGALVRPLLSPRSIRPWRA